MTRDELSETVRGLLEVINIAMPQTLQAQDKRVRAGHELLALLEGDDPNSGVAFLDELLPEHMKASVRLADPVEALRTFSRHPNTGMR